MPKVDQTLMRQADYARRRGCSREAVRRAIADGRIVAFGPDKMIDPELADAQWQRNTRARAGSAPADPGTLAAAPLAAGTDGTYAAWRCRREAAEAQAAELRLAEERGALIRVADIRLVLARHLAVARNVALGVGSRLAPMILGQQDVAHVQRLIDAEMQRFLAALVAAGDALPPSGPID